MAEENNNDRNDRDDRDDRGEGEGRVRRVGMRGGRGRRKVCRFTADPTIVIDYKNPQLLRDFITDKGKMVPRRISGNSAKYQRKVALAIKRARMIALMPFTANH